MDYKKLTDKKIKLDSYRPLDSSLVKNLEEWFKVELTFTSNAIEGNTLTRAETAMVVEKGLTVGGKSLVEHLEATNHAEALDWVQKQIKRRASTLSEKDVLHIHNLILKGIDDYNAGNYRSVAVRISGSAVVLPNPKKLSSLMEEFSNFLSAKNKLHPVEYAAEAHYKLVTIHPFTDGNGRTARLLMNMILIMSGYPPAIIRKQDRLKYINSLEKAQLKNGEGNSKDDYYKIIKESVNRSLDIYLKAIEGSSPNEKVIDGKLLKIGELAKEVGESNSTIRHWTKFGLIEVSEITESGYQMYSPEMIDRIKRIKLLKEKRLTLEEIKAEILKTS